MPTVKAKAVKKEEVKKVAVKKVTEKTEVKVSGISAEVFDAKGLKSGTVSLPKEVFGVKVNQPLMAQAVRVFLANQRQGNAHTKTRGEVDGSSKKIYRQKGTGRARHGTLRAPIFVKGGVAHGPRAHDFSLSLPQKMRKAALLSALSLKAKDGEIKVLSGLDKIEPKTKNMSALFTKITEDKKGKNKILLVASAPTKELENVYRAGRNIKNVDIVNTKVLNTYEVLRHKNLFFMKESIDQLSKGEAK